MTLEAEFLTTAADKLAENVDRIESCLTELTPDSLWARDSDNENAVGNLLLHLEGNVRQWILSGIGAAPDERDRPSEFSARTGGSASVLLAKLQGTVSEAVALIRALPHGRLAEQVSVQGYDTTVLSAIFHVVEHFSGHTYQIILVTKRFTGKNLGSTVTWTRRDGGKPSRRVGPDRNVSRRSGWRRANTPVGSQVGVL